jgi:hypothetical protein
MASNSYPHKNKIVYNRNTHDIVHLGDLFSDDEVKEIPFKTEVDLLVLSCTIYRLRNLYKDATEGDKLNWHLKTLSLLDRDVQRYVTPEDYEMANTVRDFFQKKILVLTLKGPLSPFRTDLSIFLNSNWKTSDKVFTYPDKFVGLVYKLPYFYFYDVALQDIFDGDYFTITGPSLTKGAKSVQHLKTIIPQRKNSSAIEFWFKDEQNNRVMISLEKHNPLVNVFDKMVEKPINIEASFQLRMRDSLQYYHAPVWKCVL